MKRIGRTGQTAATILLGIVALFFSSLAIPAQVQACTLCIGDLIWIDEDCNGIYDNGEVGISGVYVSIYYDQNANGIYDSEDVLMGHYISETSGRYQVCAGNPQNGTYFVIVDETTLPPGLTLSTNNMPFTYLYDTNPNDDFLYDVDFGYCPGAAVSASLGDWVWMDDNANGIQDDGEAGISGVVLKLFDCQGNAVLDSNGEMMMATTDENGYYNFNDLEPGCYVIAIDAQGSMLYPGQPLYGLVPSPRFQGGDETRDSNGYTNGWYNSGYVELGPNEENLSIDFGFYEPPQPPDELCFYPVEFWQMELENNAELLANIPRWSPFFGSSISLEQAIEILNPTDFSIENEAKQKYLTIWLNWVYSGEDQVIHYLVEGCTETPVALGQIISMIGSHFTGGKVWVGLYHTHYTSIDYQEGVYLADCLLTTLLCQECSECDGKVTQLTLAYQGENAAQVRVEQKKEGVIFDEPVEPGETFTINGADKKGTLGTEIKIYVDGALDAAIHTSCSQPIGAGMVRGSFQIVRGFSRNGGLLCPVQGQEGCSECDGKVTKLTLQYNGETSPVQVRVEQKKEGAIFDGQVSAGENFTFVGQDKKGTMGTEITIYVNDDLNTKIHTSCSQPIGPGMVKGDFEVIDAYSRNGGRICPITPDGEHDGTLCEDGVKPRALTMVYTGEGCDASDNLQDPEKASCDGDPNFADPVIIKVTDKSDPDNIKAKVWFVGAVSLDGEFEIDAQNGGENKLKSETFVHIYAGNDVLLQTVKFHTSCSQPLNIGDQFGSLVLTGFVPEGRTESEPTSAVEDLLSDASAVDTYSLLQNHPNPFNPTTVIGFQLQTPGYVELYVFNTLGQKVRTLVESQFSAGHHSVLWDARDDKGEQVTGGVYFYQIRVGDYVEIRKMSYIR